MLHNPAMGSQARPQLWIAMRAAPWAIVALLCAPNHARSDVSIGASAALRHDDNVGNAQAMGDQVQDSTASATVSLFQLLPLGTDYSLAAGGVLSGEAYGHLEGLRNASIDGVVSLKKKWGLGAFAPWVRTAVSMGRRDFEDGYRDSTTYLASVESGKRLDARWNFWTKYTLEHREASPGPIVISGVSSDAFSQVSHSLAANMDVALSERISLAIGAARRHGDVVSTTAPVDTDLYLNSRAVEADPTFGPNQFAYRLTGTTYTVSAGVLLSVSTHSLLGCALRRSETHAEGGNNYANSVAEISWNYRL
jgi:fermentation-respiration switch protein FrsA (DUF1100 family)